MLLPLFRVSLVVNDVINLLVLVVVHLDRACLHAGEVFIFLRRTGRVFCDYALLTFLRFEDIIVAREILQEVTPNILFVWDLFPFSQRDELLFLMGLGVRLEV